MLEKLADTISNPRSEGQTTQRSKLPGAQTMYRATRGSVLEKVYALVARKEERRSGYHWFLHANMNMFGPNDYIDYPRLILSDGSLQLPFGWKTQPIISTNWNWNGLDNTSPSTAQATDQLTVAAIFDNEPYQPVVLEDIGLLPIRRESYRTRTGRKLDNGPPLLFFRRTGRETLLSLYVLFYFQILNTQIPWQFLNHYFSGYFRFRGERNHLQNR